MIKNPFTPRSNNQILIDKFDNQIYHSYSDATVNTNGAVRCTFEIIDFENKDRSDDGLYPSSDSVGVKLVRITYILSVIPSGHSSIFVWVKEVTK